MVESYRDLIVWQRAIQLSVALYRFTHEFPRDEAYGLITQLRRAGVSIASNIAEGYGRMSTGEYKHYLGVARGARRKLRSANAIGYREGTRIWECGKTRASRRTFQRGRKNALNYDR
jgi:four helix bundle protein